MFAFSKQTFFICIVIKHIKIMATFTEYFEQKGWAVTEVKGNVSLDDCALSIRATDNIQADLERDFSRIWSDVEGETADQAIEYCKSQYGYTPNVAYHNIAKCFVEVECKGLCAYSIDVDNIDEEVDASYDFCSTGKGTGHFSSKNVIAYAVSPCGEKAVIAW